MINIKDKQNCCGCGACAQKCPRHCISLKNDNEGFWYPCVDTDLCIDCGLCEKVCPVTTPFEERVPLQTFAAINKNEKIRMESSSGGIFSLLAEKIINEGGVVFGTRFDEQWQVMLDYTETIEGLAPFRGSKYVQACTGETYQQCEQFLKAGRKVMYSGTPCQIAGLKHYLIKEYDNLLTVDLACHGTPSPKVWNLYLNEIVGTVNNISNVAMRDKVRGWQSFSFTMQYKKEDETISLSVPFNKNDYMNAFLKNMILRPSCYKCAVRGCKSHSDITIADYWGIQSVAPEMNDDKGTGLVLVNSEKGIKYFGKIDVTKRETTFEEGLRSNPVILNSVKPWCNRESFFSKLDNAKSVISLMQDELKPTPEVILNERIRVIMSLPKRIVKKLVQQLRAGGGTLNISHIDKDIVDISQMKYILSGRKVVLSKCDFRDKTISWSTYSVTFIFKLQ